MFGEEELVSRDVLVALLQSELESSEVEDGFCPLLLEVLQLCSILLCVLLRMLAFLVSCFISVIFLNQPIVVFDFQPQQSLLLRLKHLIGLFVVEHLLVSHQLQVFALVLLYSVLLLFGKWIRPNFLEDCTILEEFFSKLRTAGWVFCGGVEGFFIVESF